MLLADKLLVAISDEADSTRLEEFLKAMSKSGVSRVIVALESKPKTFSQIMAETRLNPGIVDRSLKVLMELELVSKSGRSYELTEKGRKALKALKNIIDTVRQNS